MNDSSLILFDFPYFLTKPKLYQKSMKNRSPSSNCDPWVTPKYHCMIECFKLYSIFYNQTFLFDYWIKNPYMLCKNLNFLCGIFLVLYTSLSPQWFHTMYLYFCKKMCLKLFFICAFLTHIFSNTVESLKFDGGQFSWIDEILYVRWDVISCTCLYLQKKINFLTLIY